MFEGLKRKKEYKALRGSLIERYHTLRMRGLSLSDSRDWERAISESFVEDLPALKIIDSSFAFLEKTPNPSPFFLAFVNANIQVLKNHQWVERKESIDFQTIDSIGHSLPKLSPRIRQKVTSIFAEPLELSINQVQEINTIVSAAINDPTLTDFAEAFLSSLSKGKKDSDLENFAWAKANEVIRTAEHCKTSLSSPEYAKLPMLKERMDYFSRVIQIVDSSNKKRAENAFSFFELANLLKALNGQLGNFVQNETDDAFASHVKRIDTLLFAIANQRPRPEFTEKQQRELTNEIAYEEAFFQCCELERKINELSQKALLEDHNSYAYRRIAAAFTKVKADYKIAIQKLSECEKAAKALDQLYIARSASESLKRFESSIGMSTSQFVEETTQLTETAKDNQKAIDDVMLAASGVEEALGFDASFDDSELRQELEEMFLREKLPIEAQFEENPEEAIETIESKNGDEIKELLASLLGRMDKLEQSVSKASDSLREEFSEQLSEYQTTLEKITREAISRAPELNGKSVPEVIRYLLTKSDIKDKYRLAAIAFRGTMEEYLLYHTDFDTDVLARMRRVFSNPETSELLYRIWNKSNCFIHPTLHSETELKEATKLLLKGADIIEEYHCDEAPDQSTLLSRLITTTRSFLEQARTKKLEGNSLDSLYANLISLRTVRPKDYEAYFEEFPQLKNVMGKKGVFKKHFASLFTPKPKVKVHE